MLLIGQGFNHGRQAGWSSVPLYVSYVLLIVCIAVAVLRYRLYEVEVIVSRALVLGIATAFVAVGYVGLVVLLSRTVEARTRGGFWWSLLAMVAVALAFQPLRRRVVVSPTDWHTGTGLRRTTRSPTSAHGFGAAPRPARLCRRSRRRRSGARTSVGRPSRR